MHARREQVLRRAEALEPASARESAICVLFLTRNSVSFPVILDSGTIESFKNALAAVSWLFSRSIVTRLVYTRPEPRSNTNVDS